jgi:glucose-6-phosphate isomerase
MAITPAALHSRLMQSAEALKSQRVERLFDTTPDRASRYRCEASELTLDFSKHLLDDDAWQTLLELSDKQALPKAFTSLTGGEIINTSEHRPALHTLLRGTARDQHPEKSKEVEDTLARIAALVDSIDSGATTGSSGQPFTDVVNLGIGGSDLGPRLVCEALQSEAASLKPHFVANIDPDDLDSTLAPLKPDTTLFVICSKSFSTEETLSNAERAIRWLQARGIREQAVGAHLIAVTTQVAKAGDWHIPPERCFPLWDWVGGRYSLWSAVGISIALALGWQSFQRLLYGAHSLDMHTHAASPAENLPMVMALLELWQIHYIGANTHVVLPYAQRLAHLPDFLQQLTMESNGKRVSPTGEPLAHDTAPVLWGSAGTIGQHSYYQLLHQGTQSFSADIILPLRSGEGDRDARRALAAHALAQSRALMVGRPPKEALQLGAERGFDESSSRQFELPGNHSHSLLIMDAITPECLGALIAAYEHKTYFLAVLLGINPFDQWGVELGKVIAGQMQSVLIGTGSKVEMDPATLAAAKAWRAANTD